MKIILFITSILLFFSCSDKGTPDSEMKEMKRAGITQTNAVKNNNISDLPLDSLLRPADQYIVSSIPVTKLFSADNISQVNSPGTVNYDFREVGDISSRIEGRIEKLYVRYSYQHIKKGERIFDIYSPELLTSQQNYIFLLKNDPTNLAMISAAKERLLLQGMTEQQLHLIAATGKAIISVGVYSHYAGMVTDARVNQLSNNVSPSMNAPVNTLPAVGPSQELQVKEGTYLQKGQSVFSVIDLNHVIISLNIYADQAAKIMTGDLVDIIPETQPDKTIKGKVSFIDPVLNTQTNTVTARVYFNNALLKLPAGSPVQATIYSHVQTGNWLPSSAVLSTGINTVVFKKIAGGFSPFGVSVGTRYADKVQVLDGLTSKDSVALNAQQLVASESTIKIK